MKYFVNILTKCRSVHYRRLAELITIQPMLYRFASSVACCHRPIGRGIKESKISGQVPSTERKRTMAKRWTDITETIMGRGAGDKPEISPMERAMEREGKMIGYMKKHSVRRAKGKKE